MNIPAGDTTQIVRRINDPQVPPCPVLARRLVLRGTPKAIEGVISSLDGCAAVDQLAAGELIPHGMWPDRPHKCRALRPVRRWRRQPIELPVWPRQCVTRNCQPEPRRLSRHHDLRNWLHLLHHGHVRFANRHAAVWLPGVPTLHSADSIGLCGRQSERHVHRRGR